MVTVAGMIVGFDSDDVGIFDEQYEFIQAAGVPVVMLGLLQAIPRTPLYERIEKAGRLRSAIQGNNTLSITNIEPVGMTYEELIDGYRRLFVRIYTWEAIGERWLSNVEQWGRRAHYLRGTAGAKGGDAERKPRRRTWMQKPLGRFRPFVAWQVLKILKYYFTADAARARFALRMLWGTLWRTPAAVAQTFSYMAYFIHLREYSVQVIAKESRFDHPLDRVDTTHNKFGEGGAINMVKLEAARGSGRSGNAGSRPAVD
jgi:hypothetical protein